MEWENNGGKKINFIFLRIARLVRRFEKSIRNENYWIMIRSSIKHEKSRAFLYSFCCVFYWRLRFHPHSISEFYFCTSWTTIRWFYLWCLCWTRWKANGVVTNNCWSLPIIATNPFFCLSSMRFPPAGGLTVSCFHIYCCSFRNSRKAHCCDITYVPLSVCLRACAFDAESEWACGFYVHLFTHVVLTYTTETRGTTRIYLLISSRDFIMVA